MRHHRSDSIYVAYYITLFPQASYLCLWCVWRGVCKWRTDEYGSWRIWKLRSIARFTVLVLLAFGTLVLTTMGVYVTFTNDHLLAQCPVPQGVLQGVALQVPSAAFLSVVYFVAAMAATNKKVVSLRAVQCR